MIKPPEYVSLIKPYIPGKPVEELERELGIKNSIKLASNENPLGPSSKAAKALRGRIGGINRYPDGGGHYLRGKLAERLDVRIDNIILGNGSNELIDVAVRTFMRPGEEAVMAAPSFVVYSMTVKAHGAKAVELPLKNYTHDLEAMAERVTKKTRMVFIANPNNPTGTINTDRELVGFMNAVPEGVLVVLDEAYCEYVTNPSYADGMKQFRKGKDVLVLRTFSKIYGLAGLRIGYGIAPGQIINEMNKIRNPFNANTLAQSAALAAIDDKGHLERSLKSNEKGKKYLYAELSDLGLRYVPTEGNFIYVLVENAFSLYEKMLRTGVIIRPMGHDAVRVTIGLPDENERFIESLKKIL